LSKLGSARLVLQKFDDALQDLKEAQRITRKTLGFNHKMEAQILCHVACLYFEAGELFSAQTTFEDALDIYRDVITTEADRAGCMAQMTETMCNIGSILNKRRSFTEAIACFKEALDLQRAAMGHDHPRVVATLDNLGYSYSKNKKYHQALTCFKEMLTAQISRQGELTPECCVTLKKMITIYEKLDKLDKAVKATQKILIRMSPIEPVVLNDIKKILGELMVKADKRGCF
jgi:tetratricopeptide (TPR) repeat protein